MVSIENQLSTILQILNSFGQKIAAHELSKTELSKIQSRLDDLDERITLRKYPVTNIQMANMLELQALLNYAAGDLKGAQRNIKEAIVTSSKDDLVTKLANDIAENNDEPKKPAILKDNTEIPEYFTVSTLRLVTLSLLTLGLYIMYWAYKSWKAVEKVPTFNKKGKKVSVHPIFSAIFFPLTSYELFKHVRTSMKTVDSDIKVSAGLNAWMILFLNPVALAFIPVLAMQKHMRYVNKKVHGDAKVRKGTSVGEVIFVLVSMVYMISYIALAAAGNSTVSPAQSSEKANVDALTIQYESCSADLAARKSGVDTTSGYAVDAYNADYDRCEEIRLKQNAAVAAYNQSIR